ncbi:polysaccharide biosynthesis tyrosine autokinase [Aureibaculum marinum]|uniref:Polysaccharide biosynthesis tyrosine autokinase n=1 Tax=Aureibaculum marinum TaxID=2487930 RepID=A0A3N4PGX7_9FLAO|nr:polysaccharide biosynthesis tyrosine autokinase [Aureibaculum marinum]RPD98793.1 polysaccharide biosynthesis tyrosine autokinase [Aureibaculum marinum]
MEFENLDNKAINDDSSEENSLDLREQVEKYLRHWKWFVIAILISFLYTFYNLNFTRSSYEAESTIKIKNENSGDKSALSAFEDMGIMSGASKDNIDDEIEVLKSKTLVSEVIKSLKLNIQFYTDKNGLSNFLDNNLGFNTEYYETENYEKPPLHLNFFINDSVLYQTESQFLIRVDSDTQYTFSTTDKSVVKKHSFGEKITTNFGDLIVLPNVDFKEANLIGKNILVSITPVSILTNNYREGLNIEPKSEFSNVLSLSVVASHKRKAEDFLDELVERYNLRAIRLKEELSKSTSEFVSERLQKISEELADVDEDVESVKSKYGVSSAASSAGLNMQAAKQIEQEKNQTSTQLDQIKQIKEIVATKGENEMIPSVGITDPNVANSVAKYNELLVAKQTRLKGGSTEKNPIVVALDDQLKSLESAINKGLQSAENSTKIALDAYNQQYNIAQSRIFGAPIQETQIRDVTRKQQTKEALFLYLLQKREETAITLGVADPNAKIIDKAESKPNRVAPKKKMAFIFALLIGLLIPFSILYLRDILDSKIHTREDIEKILSIPIIGDIPKLEGKKMRYLIKKEDHSSIAEAFRILRTNLSFILPKTGDNNDGKVVFITSSIAHEGKSLVSTNLATALSFAKKKTLILGLDIRAPKIEPYLGVRSKLGVTNFIVNSDISPNDILVSAPDNPNLDIISSGDLAPNPAELLMNARIKELFDFAKENYEYVIVDTAAFSMVTDTLLLSKFADAFIYVIRANYLDKRMLKYIKFLYKEKRLPNMALLLNGVDQKKTYGYGYGYGYGTTFENSQKKWWQFGKS